MEFYNDNENPNHWYGRGTPREDSTNSPYYNQPVHSPYLNEKFAIAAVVCGVAAMFCNFLLVWSVMLASLGILFACLSYRKGRRQSMLQYNAFFLPCLGLAVGIVTTVTTFTTVLPQMLRDPVYQQQFTTIIDNYLEIYGRMTGEAPEFDAEDVIESYLR